MIKYGNTRFQPHHMNYVMVETWEAFTVSYGNIIRDTFAKTNLLPLSPPDMITNTQASVASVQTFSEGINNITEAILAPIQFQVTRTNDPMVIIPEKDSTQQPPVFFSGRQRMTQCESELSSLFRR